jgi:hypothetical protein
MPSALISSPDIARRAAALAKVDATELARTTAATAAKTLVTPLQSAFKRAGGSATVVSAVQVISNDPGDSVMRTPVSDGAVIVGVPSYSPAAEEADSLEWGDMRSGPAAPVRTVAKAQGRAAVDRWSKELTKGLDKRVGR